MERPTCIPEFPRDQDRHAFGHWLSGFTDGEGCFLLRWDKTDDTGMAKFSIFLRQDDRQILEDIQSYFACGRVRNQLRAKQGKPQSVFEITRTSELMNVIVPHFDLYCLRAKKRRDFTIWKQGVEFLFNVRAVVKKNKLGTKGFRSFWTDSRKVYFRSLVDTLRRQRQFEITESLSVPLQEQCNSNPKTRQNMLFIPPEDQENG